METYDNVARMWIRGAWGSARHGLQCMACEMEPADFVVFDTNGGI